MFPHLTDADWKSISTSFPTAIAKMQELELLREYEGLQRACRGHLLTPWKQDRLQELETLLGDNSQNSNR